MPLLLANEVRLRGPGLLPTLGDWGTRRNGEGGIRPRAGLLNWSTFKMPALGLRWAPKTAELPAPGAAAPAMPVGDGFSGDCGTLVRLCFDVKRHGNLFDDRKYKRDSTKIMDY